MATVFMKWLERRPRDYERGIRVLTLGQLATLQAQLARRSHPGARVLEIGCGTGALAVRLAQRGAHVTAIDVAPAMLAEARRRLAGLTLSGSISLRQMDATQVGDRFEPGSFDLIVSTLVFSELTPAARRYVLGACRRLLAPGGRLLIADEVVPGPWSNRLLFQALRAPLALLVWLLTRTTTAALRGFPALLEEAGFALQVSTSYLGGSLVLFEAVPAEERDLPVPTVRRLAHRNTPRTLLVDLWALFFRIIPPYPRVPAGLYAVGDPDAGSPVLVTANFDLTVRRVVRAVDGRIDAWLLVVDTGGVNVWCAAGSGRFTAERVIGAVNSARLETLVRHRTLILPQLSAPGVDGWKVRRGAGWSVLWGPVRAADIPAYLKSGHRKTTAMAQVRFPLRDRLEMVTVTMGFYGLFILVPVLLFWRPLFWPIAAALVGLSYFYAVVHPWLPGRDGLRKSVPLALVALAGLVAYTRLWEPLPGPQLFRWAVGVAALSVFGAAELQGMSPLMRGEQANWLWEGAIGAAMALIYWLMPLGLGWK